MPILLISLPQKSENLLRFGRLVNWKDFMKAGDLKIDAMKSLFPHIAEIVNLYFDRIIIESKHHEKKRVSLYLHIDYYLVDVRYYVYFQAV